jgi:hypothetical protein
VRLPAAPPPLERGLQRVIDQAYSGSESAPQPEAAS